MKKIATISFIFLLSLHLFGQKIWSYDDKTILLEGLEKTKIELLNEVQNLNSSQFHFKPDSITWSIAEVMEHVAVYEEYLYWDLFYGQYTPKRHDLVNKVKGNDEKFLEYATEQSKGSSPWVALPLGRFNKKEDLINYFGRFRNEVAAFIKNTDCDLRLHFIYRSPDSGIWTERDLHQHTLIWIAHTERHTNQIRKIKSNSAYPKDQQKLWTEENRQFLISELAKSKSQMIAMTENLSLAQWHFKPSKESWSIAQVVEHIGLYERMVMQEAMIAINVDPQSELIGEVLTDSIYLSWMGEENPHVASGNAIPLGFMEGKNNLNFFLYGRDLILDYVTSTENDLKAQFTSREGEPNNRRSLHSLFVVHFGHTYRHLRQIERIKSDGNFPRN